MTQKTEEKKAKDKKPSGGGQLKRSETAKAEPIATHEALARLAKTLATSDAEVRGNLDALLSNVKAQDEAVKILRQIDANNEKIERYKNAAKNLTGENNKLYDDLFSLTSKVREGDDLIDLIDRETLFHTESDTLKRTNSNAAIALFGKTREFEDVIKIICGLDCEAAVRFCDAHKSHERIPYTRREAIASRLKYLRELEQAGSKIATIHTPQPAAPSAGII